jgi:hypothetical protein
MEIVDSSPAVWNEGDFGLADQGVIARPRASYHAAKA